MTIKPIKQSFQEQFWRDIQAARKVGHDEAVKQQFCKHQDAVILSLSIMNQRNRHAAKQKRS